MSLVTKYSQFVIMAVAQWIASGVLKFCFARNSADDRKISFVIGKRVIAEALRTVS